MEVVRGRGEGGIGYGVRRGLSERSAGIAYQVRFLLSIILAVLLMALQVIVSSILCPHTTDTDATMLSSTSTIVQVEEARVDIPRWLRKRWVGVRQEGGFKPLKGGQSKRSAGGCIPAFIIIIVANRYDRNRSPSGRPNKYHFTRCNSQSLTSHPYPHNDNDAPRLSFPRNKRDLEQSGRGC